METKENKFLKKFIIHPNDTVLIIMDDQKNWTETRLLIKAIKKEYKYTYHKNKILFLTKKDFKDDEKMENFSRGRSITKIELRTFLSPAEYARLIECTLPAAKYAMDQKSNKLLEEIKKDNE